MFCLSPCSGQARIEKVAEDQAQSLLVLEASKDGKPAVLLGSLCAGEKWEEEGKENKIKQSPNDF